MLYFGIKSTPKTLLNLKTGSCQTFTWESVTQVTRQWHWYNSKRWSSLCASEDIIKMFNIPGKRRAIELWSWSQVVCWGLHHFDAVIRFLPSFHLWLCYCLASCTHSVGPLAPSQVLHRFHLEGEVGGSLPQISLPFSSFYMESWSVQSIFFFLEFSSGHPRCLTFAM